MIRTVWTTTLILLLLLETLPSPLFSADKDKSDSASKALVFGAQADLHSFNRIPRPYMLKVLADLPKVNAHFFVILGDLVARQTGLDLARQSSVPIFFVYGDHEHFEEWGYIRQQGIVPARSRAGWSRHEGGVFNALCADMPLTQAWTGLPYFWSATYKGIHFIFAYSGKNQPTPSWFLQWLKRDLQDHRHLTTVIFTHRGLLESGERWNLPKQWDSIVKGSPQVKLIVYGHYHYPIAIGMLGNHSMTVDCELTPDFQGRKGETFEGGFYGLFAIAPDAIRVSARYPDTQTTLLLQERKLRTTYSPNAEVSVSLPYLVAANSKHYLPALTLRNARLRLWGVESEQIVPDSLFASDRDLAWKPVGNVSLKPVNVSESNPPLTRMLEVAIPQASGSTPALARLCRLDIAGIRFDQKAISDLMVSVENAYSALLLVKAPKGRNVALIMDTVKADGNIEATYVTTVNSQDPTRLHYIFQQVYASYVRGQKSWVWCPGPRGDENTDIAHKQAGPRQAVKLSLYLATPDTIVNPETWHAALFVFVTDSPYAPAPAGRSPTRNLSLLVSGRNCDVREVREGSPHEVPLPPLLGGSPFAVTRCEGSGLALADFAGTTDGLMHFDLRQVQEVGRGQLVVGSSCGGDPNPATGGLSILTAFAPMSADGVAIALHKSARIVLDDGVRLAPVPDRPVLNPR